MDHHVDDHMQMTQVQSVSANFSVSSPTSVQSSENDPVSHFQNELPAVAVAEDPMMDGIVRSMSTPNGDTLGSDMMNNELLRNIQNEAVMQDAGDNHVHSEPDLLCYTKTPMYWEENKVDDKYERDVDDIVDEGDGHELDIVDAVETLRASYDEDVDDLMTDQETLN